MHDQKSPGLHHRIEDRVEVQGRERSDVDDLATHTLRLPAARGGA